VYAHIITLPFLTLVKQRMIREKRLPKAIKARLNLQLIADIVFLTDIISFAFVCQRYEKNVYF
jgi:hypothetical protein